MKGINLILFFVIIFLGCDKEDMVSTQQDVTLITADNFSITIDENPQQGELLGKIEASINNGDITFEIVDQNPDRALLIDKNTGSLYINNSDLFDYELDKQINASVEVKSANISETVSVLINLKNILEILWRRRNNKNL